MYMTKKIIPDYSGLKNLFKMKCKYGTKKLVECIATNLLIDGKSYVVKNASTYDISHPGDPDNTKIEIKQSVSGGVLDMKKFLEPENINILWAIKDKNHAVKNFAWCTHKELVDGILKIKKISPKAREAMQDLLKTYPEWQGAQQHMQVTVSKLINNRVLKLLF